MPTPMRAAATVLALSLCIARPGRAQQEAPTQAQIDSSYQLLAIPARGVPRLCAVRTPSASQPRPAALRVELELDDSVAFHRVIDVTYDSLGRPIQLTDAVNALSTDLAGTINLRSATFAPDGSGTGFHVDVADDDAVAFVAADSLKRAAALQRLVPSMTRAELSQALALAQWVYAHRCDRDAPRRAHPVGEG